MRSVVYPGTFDPVTNGHTDLICRAARLFDRVVVAVAEDTGKSPLFDTARAGRADPRCGRPPGAGRGGLLLRALGGVCPRAWGPVIMRGLRAVSDFEFEFQLAGMNRRMAPDIETLFLTPAEKYAYISSSLVREIARLHGDVSAFVSPEVHAALRERFG